MLFLGTITIIGCADNAKDKIRQKAKEALPESSATSVTSSGPAAGVLHYICPNSCEGSGGAAAGTCPVCGSEYTHNTAFHANDAANTPALTPPSVPEGTPPPNPNAAQNAAGVWHYTCPAGCEGGAGAAGPCGKCGGELAHNTAFHDN